MLTWEKWVLLLFQPDSHPLGRLFVSPTLFRVGIRIGARSIQMKCFRSPKYAIVNLTTYQVKRKWVDTKVRCKINWTGNVSRSMRWSAPWSTEQAAWREEHSGTIHTRSLRGSTRHATSMWWSALVCPQFLPGIVSTNLVCRRSFLASG